MHNSKHFPLPNRFPLGDDDRLRQWLINVRRDNWTPNNTTRLCSTHFKEDQFFTDNKVDIYCTFVCTNYTLHFPNVPIHGENTW